jgi:DNA-binding NarL/FixJ family response regulator
LTTFYFLAGRDAEADADVTLCDADHRHASPGEALACDSGAGLSFVLAIRSSGAARDAAAPAAPTARERFDEALAALREHRRTDCLRACHDVVRFSSKTSDLHRAASGLELLAGHALAADGASVVDLGRERLDRCFSRVPLPLRVACECAYYAAATKFVKDRALEACGLAAFLERCENESVPGLAPLYRILAKLHYGANDLWAARSAFERGLAKLRAEPDVVTELRIHVELGLTHSKCGDTVAALESIESAVSRLVALDLNDEIASACAAAMYVLSRSHRFEEVRAWGAYALARPGPLAPAWRAILLYDVGAIDLLLGEPERALDRLAAHRTAAERMKPSDRAMLAVVEASAALYLDRYDDAAETLRAAVRYDSEQWVRLALRNVQALMLEATGEDEPALEHALFVATYPATDANAVQARAAAAIQASRLLCRLRLDRFAELRAACASFAAETPLAAIAREHAAAYERVFRRDADGASVLASAAARHPDRFHRALNRFEAARAARDLAALRAALAEFREIGSNATARRVLGELDALERGERVRSLSEREMQLAEFVASGKTNAEIARLLGLSRKTVDNHVSNILGKCGLRSRVELAALVIRGELPLRTS